MATKVLSETLSTAAFVFISFYFLKNKIKKKGTKPLGVERTDFYLFYQSFLHSFGRHWIFLSAIERASIFNIE